MKFGRVSNPDSVKFYLPEDNPDTKKVLIGKSGLKNVYIGCAKWNKQELKNFYPKGVKDELKYYSSQFNSIELNATFYGYFSEENIHAWVSKVPDHFRFFPKIPRVISHMKRLNDVEQDVHDFLKIVNVFGEKAEMYFLQLQETFTIASYDKLKNFIEIWPKGIPLAIELRDSEWFTNTSISDELYELFESNNISNIITDTAGRRDLLHMRLTSKKAFVRYVGANHKTDYNRMDEWIERIKGWSNLGLENLYFFVHQNEEKESTVLAEYFINKLRNVLDIDIQGPPTMTLDL